MGSGGAKTTNKMLAEQTQRANQIGDTAGDRSETIWNAGRGDIDWGRGELKGMYDELESGGGYGGGGGGGGYAPGKFDAQTFSSTSLPFYQNLMNNGGYSEADQANELSYASGPISGLFEGLKRNLQSQSAGRGLPSYSGGLDRLARSQAYETGNMAKGVAAGLADRILQSKLAGASGTTGVESEQRGFNVSERDKKLAFDQAERARQQAANARGRASAEQSFNDRRSLINQILGLEGDKDLAYMDRQLGAGGLATGTVNSRQDETPLWQKSLASVAPSMASAAVGAFTGNPTSALSGLKKLGGNAARSGGLSALQYNSGRNPF